MPCCSARRGFALPAPRVPLIEWIWWLQKVGGVIARRLLSQTVNWLSLELDRHPRLRGATTDAVEAPTFRGVKRLRRIPGRLKIGLAREAARGETWRTTRFALRSLARFRGDDAAPKASHLLRWEAGALIGELEALRRHWRQPGSWLVSLAMDATRLGRRDTLMTVLCNPVTGKCAVAPPIAGS